MYKAIDSAFFAPSEASQFATMKSVKQASVFAGLNYDGKAILGLALGVVMVVALRKSGVLASLKAKNTTKTAKKTITEVEELSTEEDMNLME